MAHFPSTFTENPHYFDPSEFSGADAEPFIELASRGLVVVAGLRRSDVADLTAIANQKGVREYCPNDIQKRWTDIPTTEKQLGKDGGRGVIRLEDTVTGATPAFGWTGKSSEEERSFLPMCKNTFALRVNADYRGQGLGRPFSRAIVAGSAALWDVDKVGLETWGSNTAAVRSYIGAGALLVTTKDDIRPTLDASFPIAPDGHKFEGQHYRNDVRLYMRFPQTV